MAQIVKQLVPEDYEISEKDKTVTLSEIGLAHVEELLGMALRDPERPEDITPEQARLLGFLEQALRAEYLYHRNKDYIVQSGEVVIVDEFTGRMMPGRRWSDGLHQSVEAKEGVKVQAENVTYATITIQNYFRMYEKLAGMDRYRADRVRGVLPDLWVGSVTHPDPSGISRHGQRPRSGSSRRPG